MRQAVAKFNSQALELLARLAPRYAGAQALIEAIVNADQSNQAGIEAQRVRIADLKKLLASDDASDASGVSPSSPIISSERASGGWAAMDGDTT